MDDREGEFSRNMDVILAETHNFTPDGEYPLFFFSQTEQTFIKAWVVKLLDIKREADKPLRNDYSRTLARIVKADRKLTPPFNAPPPEDPLGPLSEQPQVNDDAPLFGRPSEFVLPSSSPQALPTEEAPPQQSEVGGDEQPSKYTYKKMPCTRKTTGAIPKTKKSTRNPPPFDPFQYYNEFEDLEEIVKALARSKGQSFAEFVAAVSRHTRDFGQGLRSAMKAETSSFREYVDNVLSQRIKDLTEVLDEEQGRVLQGIKRDIEKWQIELCNVKKRIKEMVPTFDMDLYKKDKNYIKKLFAFTATGISPDEDSFKRFSEESADRLKWIQEMISNITCSNEQTMKDLTDFRCKALEIQAKEGNKQQQLMASLNCEIQTYRQLKQERDQLFRENNELLSQLEEFNC